jgi:hypothetical protein
MSADELGTKLEPRYLELDEAVDGGARMSHRLFTYRTDEGVVAGWAGSVTWTVERPTKVVWPVFKDLNLWQGATDHLYSEVLGDSEGKKVFFHDGSGTGSHGGPVEVYYVERVIPELVMVFTQPMVEERSELPVGLPGLGGVDIGYNVFMLSEFEGRCVVNVLMEHASYATFEDSISTDEALGPWHEIAPEWGKIWLGSFVPTLTRLAEEAG